MRREFNFATTHWSFNMHRSVHIASLLLAALSLTMMTFATTSVARATAVAADLPRSLASCHASNFLVFPADALGG